MKSKLRVTLALVAIVLAIVATSLGGYPKVEVDNDGNRVVYDQNGVNVEDLY